MLHIETGQNSCKNRKLKVLSKKEKRKNSLDESIIKIIKIYVKKLRLLKIVTN